MECAIKVKDTNDNKPQFTYPHEGNFIWIKEVNVLKVTFTLKLTFCLPIEEC